MNKIEGLGTTLSHLRAMHGWSQEALSAGADVSVRTIQRLEDGKPVQVETIAAVARAIGCEIADLQRIRDWIAVLPTMLQLPRARTGAETIAVARSGQAGRHYICSERREVRDAAIRLYEAARDWIDLLHDGTVSEVDAERDLDTLLDDLHAADAKLFMGQRSMDSGVRDRQGRQILLDTVIFVVYENDDAMIRMHDNREHALVGTSATIEVMRRS